MLDSSKRRAFPIERSVNINRRVHGDIRPGRFLSYDVRAGLRKHALLEGTPPGRSCRRDGLVTLDRAQWLKVGRRER